MKLLLSKREANLPLFLTLACEELRMFGVFEEVGKSALIRHISNISIFPIIATLN
jgi:hypothetical protein